VGIKALYYQLSQEHAEGWRVPEIPQLLDHLVGDKEFRVIHLKRQHLLETLISIRVAAATKQYGLINEDKKIERRIELGAEECVKHFEQTRQWESEFEGYFTNHPYMELTYENLTTVRDRECNRILDFLDVPRKKLETRMLNQRTKSLSETVTNYRPLNEHFVGTEWESFFTD
jgi:LPS sulfotransferase NodH